MKDYIDVYFLHKCGMNIKDYIELARRKDAGVSAANLAFVLSEVPFHSVPPYMLKPVTVDEIRSMSNFVMNLQGNVFQRKSSVWISILDAEKMPLLIGSVQNDKRHPF